MDETKPSEAQTPGEVGGPQVTYEPVPASGSFTRPADYYSNPTPQPGEKKGCPKWIPITCGLFGCLSLLIIFVAGYYLARGGAAKALDFTFGQVEGELVRMMGPDVPPQVQAELRSEMSRFRASVRAGRIKLTDLTPVLNDVKDVTSDQKVEGDEAARILKSLREVNRKAEGATRPSDGPTAG